MRFGTYVLAAGIALGGIFAALGGSLVAADANQTALQADRAFVNAAAKRDTAALDKLLDADFTWTDAAGKTLTRAQVLRNPPKPLIADESSARMTENSYGQVEMVQAHSGRDNILRLWVKRPAGWREIVYQEVELRTTPPTVTPGTGKTCDNPCKTLPYKPKNENERAVTKAFMALQTATVFHDTVSWAKYVADEFTGASSNSNKLISKSIRIADLKRSKMAGYAPMPVVAIRLFDFGNAAILVTRHQPVNSNPMHITRLWIKRNGHWLEAVSYQTRIQATRAKP